mgnify:CR=1 FL=1
MKILFATFDSADQFLRRLEPGGLDSPTTLRVTTRARYAAGQPVILEIGFPGLPNRILTRAAAMGGCAPAASAARSRRPATSSASSDDDQIFRLAGSEDAKRDFLIAVAAGRGSGSWTRRHRRFPLRLPARFVIDGEGVPLRGDAETEDLGSGGVALRTTRSLPGGALVTVVLEPGGGAEDIELAGRVAWSRSSAVGVEFDHLTSEPRRRLRTLLREAKSFGQTREPGVAAE